MSYIIPTLICIICILISLFPAYYIMGREKRLYALSAEKLKIAQSVLSMETLMLDGEICQGSVTHDLVVKFMQYVQQSGNYDVTWNYFRKLTPEQRDIEQRLRRELDQPGSLPLESINCFRLAFMGAFLCKHPILSRLYIIHLIGFATFLRAALRCIPIIDAFYRAKRAFGRLSGANVIGSMVIAHSGARVLTAKAA